MIEISDQHEEWLRRMVLIEVPEPLPPQILKSYEDAKRCADRIGARVTCDTLVLLCAMHGFGTPTEEEAKPESLVSLHLRKQIKYDDTVEGKWRNQTLFGKFRGITGDKKKVKVLFDGQDEERHIVPDDVWIPKAVPA